MEKLLVICGPTATGKSPLALHLSKVLGGEIVSADSRQVYKGMDVGTGKDLPVNVKCQNSNLKWEGRRICFFTISSVKIWGYDLVDPTKEFSVSQYSQVAMRIIKNILSSGKLPILVGGTGFYIKALIDGVETINVPRNLKLRKELSKKPADELFEMLKIVDPVKAVSMNEPDRRNPRRLVRAIEVGRWVLDVGSKKLEKSKKIPPYNVLFVGLTAPKEELFEKIETRVYERVKKGMKNEIERLLSYGVVWDNQAMQTFGYRQWRDFFEGVKGESEVIARWIYEEQKYAKRQITWFKKDKRIKWFDVSKVGWREGVEKVVREWHNTKYHAAQN